MEQKPYPAEKARGGEIILNTPARRAIFFDGPGRRRCPGACPDDRSLIAMAFRAATSHVRERRPRDPGSFGSGNFGSAETNEKHLRYWETDQWRRCP